MWAQRDQVSHKGLLISLKRLSEHIYIYICIYANVYMYIAISKVQGLGPSIQYLQTWDSEITSSVSSVSIAVSGEVNGCGVIGPVTPAIFQSSPGYLTP